MTYHLRLNFDLVEGLSVVDTDNASDHLGNDNHISQVSFDALGLFVGHTVLLGNAKLLYQTHRLALQTTLELASGTAVYQVDQLFILELEQVF